MESFPYLWNHFHKYGLLYLPIINDIVTLQLGIIFALLIYEMKPKNKCKEICLLDNHTSLLFPARRSFAYHETSTDEASYRQGSGNTIISRKKLAMKHEKEVEHTPPILLLLFPLYKRLRHPINFFYIKGNA